MIACKERGKRTDQNTHTPSWKAAPSRSPCQIKDNLLCEGSSRQRKDYSPPISIKHTGNTLTSHVWWWRDSEFNALRLLFWVLIRRIHIILLLTLEMNDRHVSRTPSSSSCLPSSSSALGTDRLTGHLHQWDKGKKGESETQHMLLAFPIVWCLAGKFVLLHYDTENEREALLCPKMEYGQPEIISRM